MLEELADGLMEKETVEKDDLGVVLAKVQARPSRKIQPVLNGDLVAMGEAVVHRLRRVIAASDTQTS